MIQRYDSLLAKSFCFWASNQVNMLRFAVFPTTVYNVYVPEHYNIYAGRLGMYSPTRSILHEIASDLLLAWDRPTAYFSLQQLEWALTNIPRTEHQSICDFVHEFIYYQRRDMKPPQSDTIPSDVLDKLRMSLASLEQSLLAKDPLMPRHLKSTHELLLTYPETVHLLDDGEIAKLIDGAKIHANVEIVKASVPKTGGRKKASADDL